MGARYCVAGAGVGLAGSPPQATSAMAVNDSRASRVNPPIKSRLLRAAIIRIGPKVSEIRIMV
jgi:hypothetical protein